MEVRDNECQISQNDILNMKFSEFYLCIHKNCEYTGQIVKFDIHFLRPPW